MALRERIAKAAFRVFGVVQGNGQSSGRKVLRQNLKGPTLADWYPPSMKEWEAPG